MNNPLGRIPRVRNRLQPPHFLRDALSTKPRFDSAQMYENEHEVGSAINSWLSSKANTTSLKREDIHFTTKLATNSSYDAARASIRQSLKLSGMGHIDLFLLHSPYGGKHKRLECWKAVEDAIEDGEIKAGGVSNFGVKHVCSRPRRWNGTLAR